MRLEIANQETLHSILTSRRERHYLQEGLQEDEEEYGYIGDMPMISDPIILPPPLRAAKLAVRNVGDTYAVSLNISATGNQQFSGVSAIIAREMNKKSSAYLWKPTQKNFVGYVVDAQTDDPTIAVSDLDIDGARFKQPARRFGFGCAGTIPVEIPTDGEEFLRQISLLESFVNNFIRAFYQVNKSPQNFRGPDRLYIDPVLG